MNMNSAQLRHREHGADVPPRVSPNNVRGESHLSDGFDGADRNTASFGTNNIVAVAANDANNSNDNNDDGSFGSSPASPIKDGSAKATGGASTSIVAGFAAESSLPLTQSAIIALAYTVGSTVFFLLIRYSKKLEKEGALKYDNAAAVFFIELVKWTFSVAAMYYRTGKFLPTSVFKEGTWRVGIYYAVPSGIYFIYNNFTFYNLQIFDPATYQVFMQTRVLFTGVLYSLIFHKHLSRQKWIALVLLTVGVASKYLSWNFVVVDPRVTFMLFQASLSAFAGVYNEFLLKKDISMDVNEQNFFMYSFALVFNLGYGLQTNPEYYTSGKVFSNLNSVFLWIVVTGALMGISASLVLKFINVIVKAFASATEVLITAVLAFMFLGEDLTGKDMVACCIVMSAIYLYYHQMGTPGVVEGNKDKDNNSSPLGNNNNNNNFVASSSSSSNSSTVTPREGSKQ